MPMLLCLGKWFLLSQENSRGCDMSVVQAGPYREAHSYVGSLSFH